MIATSSSQWQSQGGQLPPPWKRSRPALSIAKNFKESSEILQHGKNHLNRHLSWPRYRPDIFRRDWFGNRRWKQKYFELEFLKFYMYSIKISLKSLSGLGFYILTVRYMYGLEWRCVLPALCLLGYNLYWNTDLPNGTTATFLTLTPSNIVEANTFLEWDVAHRIIQSLEKWAGKT